jgi:septal ring factor EnvC (AmiA/AmiB activator)
MIYRTRRPSPGGFAMRAILLLVMLTATVSSLYAQGEIRKNQTQLKKLRSEIKSYESKIKEKEKKENATLGQLDNYTRQERLLRSLTRKLQKEENELKQSVAATKGAIDELTEQIEHLKKQYAGYVRSVYRKGSAGDLELLLTSASVNQFVLRSEYLKRFSLQRKRDLDSIASKRAELEEKKSLLDAQLAAQQKLIAEKAAEKERLRKLSNRKKNVLASIRRDKQNYRKEIDRRKKDFKEVEKKIAALIEAAARKRNSSAGSTVAPGGGKFSVSRGKLLWPVNGGKVLTKFGNQKHPVLNTITESKGIDIGISSGSPISAVADGEVSTIWWLPSYGNLVIVAHDGDYRTVYAHLSDINVDEGDAIRGGQVIGRSGEGLNGPMLHFEVWKGRKTEDPEKWLMSRRISRK